jgi:hypothetical protein
LAVRGVVPSRRAGALHPHPGGDRGAPIAASPAGAAWRMRETRPSDQSTGYRNACEDE